jgi:hypothetical protein
MLCPGAAQHGVVVIAEMARYVLAVSERISARVSLFGARLLTGVYWNQLAMYSSSTRRAP